MTRKSERNRKNTERYSPSGQVSFLLEKPVSKMAATAMLDEEAPATPVKKKDLDSDTSFSEVDFQKLISELPEEIDDEVLVKNGGNILKKLLNTVSILLVENKSLRDRLEILEKKNSPSQKRLDNYYQRLITLEIEHGQLNQYGRRNNVELAGIPESVDSGGLEDKVIEVLAEIDVNVNHSDIEACHRLGRVDSKRGPRRTIVRFVNRKKCDSIMANKRNLAKIDGKKLKLGNNKIYANYSLCPMYRALWWNCKKLHAAGRIHSFWVSGGTVKMAVREGSAPVAILHQSQLWEAFSDFNFKADIVRPK